MNNPLSALVSAGDIRREVKIRGATFTLRLLTMAEVYDLIAAVPVVIPPVTVNGQQVENRRDPAYLSAEAARQRSIRMGELAIALDLPGVDGATWRALPGVGERRAWLIHVERQITTTLLGSEVEALEKVLADNAAMQIVRDPRQFDAEPERLPERYGVTGAYIELRLCERYGQDPLAWPERFAAAPRGVRAMLAEYELIREQQEAKEAGHGVG